MLLQLHVETFRGPVGRPPSLQLAAWLAWGGPDRPWALTLVERRDDGALAAREDAVAAKDVDTLRAALDAAGLGQRPVRVQETIDTSDTAGQVRIRALRESWSELVIPMLSSGFEGEDAPALRDFLRRLLDVAAVRSADVRWATLGE